jgi:hypothetical protein
MTYTGFILPVERFERILSKFTPEECERLIPILENNPSEKEVLRILNADFDLDGTGFNALGFPYYESLPEDWDWRMPTLRQRKDIWENFPVCVKQIDNIGKAEAYSIQWHKLNLANWMYDRLPKGDFPWDYADDTERRMFKALAASRYWKVQPARNENELCVIVMNFKEESAVASAAAIPAALPTALPTIPEVAEEAEEVKKVTRQTEVCDDEGEWQTVTAAVVAVAPAVPEKPVWLTTLLSIKASTSICWNEEASKVYSVSLFMRSIREKGQDPKQKTAEVLNAIKKASCWRVLPATSYKEVCRVQIF